MREKLRVAVAVLVLFLAALVLPTPEAIALRPGPEGKISPVTVLASPRRESLTDPHQNVNELWNWTYYPGPGGSSATAVDIDPAGGIFVAGFDGAGGFWTVHKLSPDGKPLWYQVLADPGTGVGATGIVTAGNDTAVVTGWHRGTTYEWRASMVTTGARPWDWIEDPTIGTDNAEAVAWDGSSGTPNFYVAGGIDDLSKWAVVKLSSSGSKIWEWNSTSRLGEAFAVTMDSGGAVYVGGVEHINSEAEQQVTKLTSDGKLEWIWDKNSTAGGAYVRGLADGAGLIYAAGHSAISADDEEWSVVALRPDGSVAWNWSENPTSQQDRLHGVAANPIGGTYAVGHRSDLNGSMTRWSVISLTSTGARDWEWNSPVSWGSGVPWGTAVSPDGDLVVAGVTNLERNPTWRVVKLRVDPAPPLQLDRVVVTPPTAQVALGDSVKFAATGYDRYGGAVAGVAFSWTVPSTIGTVDQTGLFRATASGSGNITVTGTINGTSRSTEALVTVAGGPVYVVSYHPTDGATGVEVNSSVMVRWNKAMERSSSQDAFSASPTLVCTFTWPSSYQMSCEPFGGLAGNTSHCVTIAGTARELSGEEMGAPHSFCFKTGAAPPPPESKPPVVGGPPDGLPFLVLLLAVGVSAAAAVAALVVFRRRQRSPPPGDQGRARWQ